MTAIVRVVFPVFFAFFRGLVGRTHQTWIVLEIFLPWILAARKLNPVELLKVCGTHHPASKPPELYRGPTRAQSKTRRPAVVEGYCNGGGMPGCRFPVDGLFSGSVLLALLDNDRAPARKLWSLCRLLPRPWSACGATDDFQQCPTVPPT